MIEEINNIPFIETPEKIHKEIASYISNGSSYIDSLVEYSKKHGIEIETLGEIIKKSPVLKQKIRSEAQKMRLIKEEKQFLENFFESDDVSKP